MVLRGARHSTPSARRSDMDLALTADLGNSRLKLCAWDLARLVVVARAASRSVEDAGRDAAEFARVHGPFRGAALSSVASPEREAEVASALRAAAPAGFRAAPDCGLALEVREPTRVGRDRLYAARGALELLAGSSGARGTGVVVLDAGTALTVDAVDVAGNGRFLGGAIAPGPTLLARALAEHTARLPLVEPVAGVPALGRDTESALRAGVVVGFRGAALELALRVASEAGFRTPRVVLTGGASGLLGGLFDSERFGAFAEDPDLVHRGLLASLCAALGP